MHLSNGDLEKEVSGWLRRLRHTSRSRHLHTPSEILTRTLCTARNIPLPQTAYPKKFNNLVRRSANISSVGVYWR
jgi:hypothetical protein